MSIPTQMSLVGFVASSPALHFTSAGAQCCRLRVGVTQWRKEGDGNVSKLVPSFHDVVTFEHTAHETFASFRRGGSFVASGHIHEHAVERSGEIRERFAARKIGHDVTRTVYEVQRRRQAPSHHASQPASKRPTPAVGP